MTEFKELVMYSKDALEAITQNMDKAVKMVPYLTKIFFLDLVLMFFFALILYLNNRVEKKKQRSKTLMMRENKREIGIIEAMGWIFCQGFLSLLIIVIMTYLIFRTITTITLPVWNARYQKTLEDVLIEPLVGQGFTRQEMHQLLETTGLDSLSNAFNMTKTSILKIGDLNINNLSSVYHKTINLNFDTLKDIYIEHITPALETAEPITNLATKTLAKSTLDLGLEKLTRWPLVGPMVRYTRNLLAPGANLKAAELIRLKEDLNFGFTNFAHYFLPALYKFYKNVFISSFGASLSITGLLKNRKNVKTLMNKLKKIKKQQDNELLVVLQNKLQNIPTKIQAVSSKDYGPLSAYHQMIMLPIQL